jgi:hypothetical protein
MVHREKLRKDAVVDLKEQMDETVDIGRSQEHHQIKSSNNEQVRIRD